MNDISSIERSTEKDRFFNACMSLMNIDMDELVAAGIIKEGNRDNGGTSWKRFNDQPLVFLAKIDDAKRDALWKLLEARQRIRLSAGTRDVLSERQRQIDIEEFDASHDDCATRGQLTEAAINYAAAAALTVKLKSSTYSTIPPFSMWSGISWPWDIQWWKPGPVRRMLVKAAALIIAEIDRLDRIEEKLASVPNAIGEPVIADPANAGIALAMHLHGETTNLLQPARSQFLDDEDRSGECPS